MKFLPENNKRKKYSIAILTIAVAGIVYVSFFAGAPKAVPVPFDPETNIVPDETGAAAVGNQPAAQSAPAAENVSSSKILPYGEKIDDSVLRDPRFTKLRPTPDLNVSPEELGQANLFGQ